jgi:protein-L-isoaspartate O-methyltransferase
MIGSYEPQSREVSTKTGVDTSVLEQLLKGIVDLEIEIMRRADEQLSTSDRHHILCDDAMQNWRRCDEYKEVLRHDLV